MAELDNQEKQKIFLGLDKIFKTMTGLKEDILIAQNQLETRVKDLEDMLKEIQNDGRSHED